MKTLSQIQSFSSLEVAGDLFLLEEDRITCIDNQQFLHHLAYHDLDVLIVDLHTLETVHFLNFVHDIGLHRTWTFDGQDFGWNHSTIG